MGHKDTLQRVSDAVYETGGGGGTQWPSEQGRVQLII